MMEENKIKDKPGRIESLFIRLKKKNNKAFIPFITGGFPDMDRFKKLFLKLDRSGADIIEIGVPFSDPLADGPIVQSASMIALEQGFNADILFEAMHELRQKSRIPIVLMTYFNTVYGYGFERFLLKAKKSGTDGIIIPDLPIDEFYAYKKIFREINIDNIMLASLNSAEGRLREIAKECRGFLYCVSVKGVTGVRDQINEDVIDMLKKLKEITRLPLCPGFGISELAHIKSLIPYSDGIIIGSKLISMILESRDFDEGLKKIDEFLVGVNSVLKNK